MFIKKSIFIFGILFTIFAVAGLQAQTKLDTLLIPSLNSLLNESGCGTKACGMGRSFTALADDPTAIEWNPAGLIQIEKSLAYLSGRFSFGNVSTKEPISRQGTYSISATDRAQFYLNYIGFSFPFKTTKLNLVGGIAVRSMSDFGGNFIVKETENETENTTEYGTETRGGVYSMSPALGFEVLPELGIGMAINFISGKYKIRTSVSKTMNSLKEDKWEENTQKYSGASFDIGVLWKPLKEISLGTKISFPYTINISNITSHDYTNRSSGEYDVEKSLTIPTLFSFGLASRLSKEFTFAMDYHIKPWRKIRLGAEGRDIDRLFEPENSFHTGLEYLLKSNNALVPMRIGFYIDPTQIFEISEESSHAKGDRIIKNVFTLGSGFIMKGFSLEFAFDYYLLQYSSFENPNLNNLPNHSIDINHSKYNFTLSSIISL